MLAAALLALTASAGTILAIQPCTDSLRHHPRLRTVIVAHNQLAS
jgi:hypothetical protein